MNDSLPLELAFPHIVVNLVMFWRTIDCSEYINNLIFDDRHGRKGFTRPVLDELHFLLELNDTLINREYTEKPWAFSL